MQGTDALPAAATEDSTIDPSACLRLAAEALDEGDRDAAADFLAEYRNWRLRGGFEPPDGDQRADELARRLCRLHRPDDDGNDDGTD